MYAFLFIGLLGGSKWRQHIGFFGDRAYWRLPPQRRPAATAHCLKPVFPCCCYCCSCSSGVNIVNPIDSEVKMKLKTQGISSRSNQKRVSNGAPGRLIFPKDLFRFARHSYWALHFRGRESDRYQGDGRLAGRTDERTRKSENGRQKPALPTPLAIKKGSAYWSAVGTLGRKLTT